MVGQALLSLSLQRKKEFIQILHQEMVVITTAMEIERMRYPNRNRTVVGTVDQLEAHFCLKCFPIFCKQLENAGARIKNKAVCLEWRLYSRKPELFSILDGIRGYWMVESPKRGEIFLLE
jgi:hypothetical protein